MLLFLLRLLASGLCAASRFQSSLFTNVNKTKRMKKDDNKLLLDDVARQPFSSGASTISAAFT
ncbi:hypothetical protein PSP31121_01236 [Pandoraea sputorum]|uniref:Secreted protein n=1 Tax=Pandoraea sputorum TaxID=93222 RepID=A0A5E5AV30_9BURK|nr:hypothetical protein PSP31121_01236 [Pandoraea sputorum]